MLFNPDLPLTCATKVLVKLTKGVSWNVTRIINSVYGQNGLGSFCNFKITVQSLKE